MVRWSELRSPETSGRCSSFLSSAPVWWWPCNPARSWCPNPLAVQLHRP
uniref:Uncharacterized protein n=1 Tax=Arundo donax TaxID=35708 RepID=A0A0A9EEB5_ARUDO